MGRKLKIKCAVCGATGEINTTENFTEETPKEVASDALNSRVNFPSSSTTNLWLIHKEYPGIVNAGELPVKIHAHFPEVPKSRLEPDTAVICGSCFTIIQDVLQMEKQMLKMKARLNIQTSHPANFNATSISAATSRKSKPKEKCQKNSIPVNVTIPTVQASNAAPITTRVKRKCAVSGLSKEIISAELDDNVDLQEDAEINFEILTSAEDNVSTKRSKLNVRKSKCSSKSPSKVRSCYEVLGLKTASNQSLEKIVNETASLFIKRDNGNKNNGSESDANLNKINNNGDEDGVLPVNTKDNEDYDQPLAKKKRKRKPASQGEKQKPGRPKKPGARAQLVYSEEIIPPAVVENDEEEEKRRLIRKKASTMAEADKFFCCPKCCVYFKEVEYENFKSHIYDECFVKKRFPCLQCGHIYTTQNVLEFHVLNVHVNPHPKSKLMKVKPRKEFVTEMTKIITNADRLAVLKEFESADGSRMKCEEIKDNGEELNDSDLDLDPILPYVLTAENRDEFIGKRLSLEQELTSKILGTPEFKSTEVRENVPTLQLTELGLEINEEDNTDKNRQGLEEKQLTSVSKRIRSKTKEGDGVDEKLLVKIQKELEEDDWPDDENRVEQLAKETGSWKCWICFYESKQKSLWQTHMNRIHPDAVGLSLECEFCNFLFTKKHHLREHLQEVHSENTGFKCKICDRKFLYKNGQHLCEKITCDICGETFDTRGQRTKHMLIHPEYRPHKCTLCPKEFQKREYLSIHMRVHNDLRPYGCEFCERRFRSKSHYNNHRRLHTGEKPYICHTCGRAFFSPQCLYNHLNTHAGTKNCVCDACGKAFRSGNDLKRHQVIHTGDKPHVCTHCGKAFNRRGNCLVHERSHMSIGEFKCHICDHVFDRSKKLEKHVKKMHKVPVLKPVKPKSTSSRSKTNMTISKPNGLISEASLVEIEDIASNVEIGEEILSDIHLTDDRVQIQVWQQGDLGFLNMSTIDAKSDKGGRGLPMYVTVVPVSSMNDVQTVEDVEIMHDNLTVSSNRTLHQVHFETDSITEGDAFADELVHQ